MVKLHIIQDDEVSRINVVVTNKNYVHRSFPYLAFHRILLYSFRYVLEVLNRIHQFFQGHVRHINFH